MPARAPAHGPQGAASAMAALPALPWSHPWLDPWRALGQSIEGPVTQGVPVWQALNRIPTAPVRFAAHTVLPAGVAYEQFIAQTACCPTRDGWHDFLNGLCWSLFPATKSSLNRLQAARIAQDGILPTRGALRDTLTVFDENAALLRAPDALWEALAGKQWQRVFVDLRPLWRQSRLVLFGHALLEKLMLPRKSITAHVVRVRTGSDELADWDRWIASELQAGRVASQPFVHLPVLGVPGWWRANEDPVFYQDPQVFRPARAPMSCGQ